MSQIFKENGKVIPITLVEAGPCYITQIKTEKLDKYKAVQLGFIKKTRKTKKTEKGKEFRYLREFRIVKEDKSSFPPFAAAQVINVSVFQEGEKVKVSGTSKGKGFAGGVKRWGFKGKTPKTHGTKHEARGIGSTGMSGHQRVMKGKRMPGRMGSERITIKNLEIIKVDKENNLLALKGATPGRIGALLEISSRS